MHLLMSAPTAACSARLPHASPPLGLSLLLQGSRLRARLSLPSCSPVSQAFSGAALLCVALLFSLSSFHFFCPPGYHMHLLWVMVSVVGTQIRSRVVSLGPFPTPGPLAPCPMPWCCVTAPKGGAKVAEAMGQFWGLGMLPFTPPGWLLGPSPSLSIPS